MPEDRIADVFAQGRMTELFFEIFTGLPRQGPGEEASTLRALGLTPSLSPQSRVLDVGCGTGAQTLVLARHVQARIIAIDRHEPFVHELNLRLEAEGLAPRVEARVGDMARLDFAPGSFDLIWCEGAVYAMGFDQGLREWRRLLAPGGHMALTDATWLRDDVPAECLAFWRREYPAIRSRAANLTAIQTAGYELVGDFVLPSSVWWDDYYRPLETHVTRFRARHQGEDDALALATQVQEEIDVWRRYSEYYAYVFYVMRRQR